MSRFMWALAVVLGVAIGGAAWMLANQPVSSAAPVTAPHPAAPTYELPQPGQKLMPVVIGTDGLKDLPYNTVQIGSLKNVATVEFGFNQPMYQRYTTACDQLKVRDGLKACDNQLVLTDDQCKAMITAGVRQEIINWTGTYPATVRCQVIAKPIGTVK